MITGASRADAAILVISADEGVREQSRRHAYLLSMLGIKHVVVVVNKMDLVDYSEKRFREIEQEYRKFLRELGLNARTFIPASAKRRRERRAGEYENEMASRGECSRSTRFAEAARARCRSSTSLLCSGCLSL